MRISELIDELNRIFDKHGDIQCVHECDNFFGDKKILSTIETVKVKPFGADHGPAVWLDHRMG